MMTCLLLAWLLAARNLHKMATFSTFIYLISISFLVYIYIYAHLYICACKILQNFPKVFFYFSGLVLLCFVLFLFVSVVVSFDMLFALLLIKLWPKISHKPRGLFFCFCFFNSCFTFLLCLYFIFCVFVFVCCRRPRFTVKPSACDRDRKRAAWRMIKQQIVAFCFCLLFNLDLLLFWVFVGNTLRIRNHTHNF